jgi:hypothetical protein
MEDNDFMFNDEDDELDESSFFDISPSDSDDDDNGEEEEEQTSEEEISTDKAAYADTQISPVELELIRSYDTIANLKLTDNLEPAVIEILEHIPSNTSSFTVNCVLRDIFHSQGHARRQNSVYDAELISSSEYLNDEDEGANKQFYEQTKKCIQDFIKYLSERDLTWDSAVSRRIKNRQLPAFLIFLFSIGQYGYLINCPTLPKCYSDQVVFAFKKINEEQEKIIESLAKAYEEANRPVIAKKVRELGPRWFSREPAEALGNSELKAIGFNAADTDIYRGYRSQWTNVSKSITQEFISDYIEVVLDEKKGIHEKLKDKTRAEAITSVKKLFEEWSKEQEGNESTIARDIIFK